MALLTVRQLVKSYNGRKVVDRVSFEVDAGEIVGLLGRNGAGKTTSFRMTIGMITPEAGQVVFGGQDVTAMPMYKHALAGMGYLSQEPSVFQKLTVEQNLQAILETQRLSKAARHKRTAELLKQGYARPQQQVISVGQNDLHAAVEQVLAPLRPY